MLPCFLKLFRSSISMPRQIFVVSNCSSSSNNILMQNSFQSGATSYKLDPLIEKEESTEGRKSKSLLVEKGESWKVALEKESLPMQTVRVKEKVSDSQKRNHFTPN